MLQMHGLLHWAYNLCTLVEKPNQKLNDVVLRPRSDAGEDWQGCI